MVRDFQRARVYAAERNFHGYRLQTADAVRSYVGRIVRSAWWQRRSAVREVEVHEISRARYYSADRESRYVGFVILRGDAKAHDESTILHELAHILTPANVSVHGPEFCHDYLNFVLKWMGPEAFVDLKSRFTRKKVQY